MKNRRRRTRRVCVCSVSVVINKTSGMWRRCTGLPVGALAPHRVFPVRDDVGPVVLDDVVVILSIWGKGLGGTGHLGLENVEQILLCSPSGDGGNKIK